MKKISAWMLVCLLTAAPLASAHYLWLETPPEGSPENSPTVQIYYGEYEEGRRERSPGRLDEVSRIELFPARAEGDAPGMPVPVNKELYFEAPSPGENAGGWVQVRELERPVADWTKYGIGIVKPEYYASALLDVSAENIPALPEEKTLLAVYPVRLGTDSEVVVYFKDEPLSGAKVMVHAPNEWTKEWKTDEAGKAEVNLPWPGLYVFEVIHIEEAPGEYEGVAYEAIRHRATFTYRKTA